MNSLQTTGSHKLSAMRKTKKCKLQIVYNDNSSIIGTFRYPSDMRASDYLRSGDSDRLLMTEVDMGDTNIEPSQPFLFPLTNTNIKTIIILDNKNRV